MGLADGGQRSEKAKSGSWLLVYDRECSICVKFRNLAKRWDRQDRILEADLDSALIQDIAPGFRPREIPKNFHLILPDGTVRTGEMALPDLFRLFPCGAPLAWLFRNLPGSRHLLFRVLRYLGGH